MALTPTGVCSLVLGLCHPNHPGRVDPGVAKDVVLITGALPVADVQPAEILKGGLAWRKCSAGMGDGDDRDSWERVPESALTQSAADATLGLLFPRLPIAQGAFDHGSVFVDRRGIPDADSPDLLLSGKSSPCLMTDSRILICDSSSRPAMLRRDAQPIRSDPMAWQKWGRMPRRRCSVAVMARFGSGKSTRDER